VSVSLIWQGNFPSTNQNASY